MFLLLFTRLFIEKHFTLDRNLPGPDHKASIEAKELEKLVSFASEIELSLGTSVKYPSDSELKNMFATRKSLVASKPIKKGEIFSDENLTSKRPGDGIKPLFYWDLIGMEASRNYEIDDKIQERGFIGR